MTEELKGVLWNVLFSYIEDNGPLSDDDPDSIVGIIEAFIEKYPEVGDTEETEEELYDLILEYSDEISSDYNSIE